MANATLSAKVLCAALFLTALGAESAVEEPKTEGGKEIVPFKIEYGNGSRLVGCEYSQQIRATECSKVGFNRDGFDR